MVEEPFSEAAVCKAIERWLLDRGYEFGVRMVSLEEAGGSGLIRKLREMDIESEVEGAISIEDMERELKKAEDRRLSNFIEGGVDKRKVFYYEGFYGSLVPDVESDRLLGRIEDITQDIVYGGKTVRECEQRFREAVSGYKKGYVRSSGIKGCFVSGRQIIEGYHALLVLRGNRPALCL